MRVLLIHNYYQQPGGEDAIFEQETALLRENGVAVETLTFTNENFDGTLAGNLRSAVQALYNTRSADRVALAIDRFRPDIVHVHNLFYTASASVIRTAKQRGVPVVMTLHNYRLLCVNGLLMRDGMPCETCLTQTFPVAGIRHACFRNSPLQSAQLSLTTMLHKLTGIWRSVDRFVVMTDFARRKVLSSSLRLSPEQVSVKPNFVPDAGCADPHQRDDLFLYVGRLSAEKGIDVLLEAARKNPFRLRIIGDGPLATDVVRAAATVPTIEYVGWQKRAAVLDALKRCRAVIVPSLCYEGLPTVILEAFATGTPVICSNQDNLNQIVTDGRTGLLFRTGDSADLNRVLNAFSQQPADRLRLAQNSRDQYLLYTKELSYQTIRTLYDEVLGAGLTAQKPPRPAQHVARHDAAHVEDEVKRGHRRVKPGEVIPDF